MSEFAQSVMALVPASASFKPFILYDPDGDTLQFVNDPDTYSGVRIDDALTVYISDERDNRVIGGLIKDFRVRCKRLIDQMPGLSDAAVADGKVRIDEMLSAYILMTRPPDDRQRSVYRSMAKDTVRQMDNPWVSVTC